MMTGAGETEMVGRLEGLNVLPPCERSVETGEGVGPVAGPVLVHDVHISCR